MRLCISSFLANTCRMGLCVCEAGTGSSQHVLTACTSSSSQRVLSVTCGIWDLDPLTRDPAWAP